MQGLMIRVFGEVYVAFDNKSDCFVAIKKVKEEVDENGLKVLRNCYSRYVVRYYDVVREEGELWVGVG